MRTGRDVRRAAREGRLRGATGGLAPGFVQANVAVLPVRLADDFLRYCRANPRPCPLLEVLEPGDPEPERTAPGADLRTDVPAYRVYREGRLASEPEDLREGWRDDLVGFLLGCSYTFEQELAEAGFRLPHARDGGAVSMYRTAVPTEPAGPFRGPLVVSMRPLPEDRVDEARRITGRLPLAHGAPLHVGDPSDLGIGDLSRPDYGDPWLPEVGEVPAFWACGVTPQAAAVASGVEFLATHAPGHMFVTDVRMEEVRDVEPTAWDAGERALRERSPEARDPGR